MAKKNKKITKKELKRDRMVEYGTKFVLYIRRQRIKVSLIVGGILIIIVGGVYFQHTVQIKQRQAEFEFREAMAIYGTGNVTEALTRFQDISTLYRKTTAGINAIYWLGNIYYLQGNYKEARKYYEDYLKKGKDKVLLESTLLGIGDTHLQENDYFSAAQKYEEFVTQHTKSWLAPKALFQTMRCYQLLNQPDKANSTIQKLTQNYPTSQYTQKANLLTFR